MPRSEYPTDTQTESPDRMTELVREQHHMQQAHPCPDCKGDGYVGSVVKTGPGPMDCEYEEEPCRMCGGYGYKMTSETHRCATWPIHPAVRGLVKSVRGEG